MAQGLTPSEIFVSNLCSRAFLRLWTHPNPIGKKGKELCDCLIVCDDDVIIISVKEIEYKDTGDSVGWERWMKAAIEKSAAQLYGSERWLKEKNSFQRSDGTIISLPPRERRRYHRISVSLGGRGKVPLKWGDLGKGFVHVWDEHNVDILFGHLDTISDFTKFVTEVESLIRDGTVIVFGGGGIEDLLALFLTRGQSFDLDLEFPRSDTAIVLDSGLWEYFSTSEDFKSYQEAYKYSYYWDRLIETYADDFLAGQMFDMHSKKATSENVALAIMAIQPRGYRDVLAEQFMDFQIKQSSKVKARVAKGYRDTAFVFQAGSSSDRDSRIHELFGRCLVVRGKLDGVKRVVGIATDRPGTSEIGYSSDIVYLFAPEMSDEQSNAVETIQKELGYFRNLKG